MPPDSERRSDSVTYRADAIEILERRDHEAMLDLASDPHTPPEMLVFLSQSESGAIRAAVAANSSSPSAIGDVLANDGDAAVRMALGRRISALLPELVSRENSRLATRAEAVLSRLVHDTDAMVRRVLADSLCRLDCAPKELVLTLARDVETLVAVPICELSPLLDDDDLIALISSPGTPSALAAIARRDGLGADVSDSLVGTGDIEAIGALLENATAQIREATIERIVELAAPVEAWHEALCARQELTGPLALKIAGFVAERYISQLAEREDLADTCKTELQQMVNAALSGKPARPDEEFLAVPTAEEISAALASGHESRLYTLIAARGHLSSSLVRRIFQTRQPKAIVALVFQVGLPMELAERLQRFPGLIAEADILRARTGGEYPMSEKDINWQLAAFGIQKPAETEQAV